ncbi:MAG: Fe-S cluster assembly protein SufD [Brevefilum sp.]|nr:Fe-S cluster assembly protein SufD [Brevefilum sp.]MDT8381078.1 Fe-S cluster assembly protein SufD [Brevefilum sp.]MDW7754182.1 Fe-S cluster assembly protein SufD [Brevefilum sp.]
MTSKPPKVIIKKTSGRTRESLTEFKFDKQQMPLVKEAGLMEYRENAWENYQKLSFPNLKDEAWRRTDIRHLNSGVFSLPDEEINYQDPPKKLLNPNILGDGRSGQIVSGAIETQIHLDQELSQKGVVFTDFHTAEINHSELLSKFLGKIVSPDEDKFTALAAALARDGVFLYVPKNVVIDQPLHSLYWGAGENTAFINHIIVWLEDGAQVTFVHESSSPKGNLGSQVFHDGIVEIYVGKNAHLSFVELQSWGQNVWSFTRERAKVMGDGKLDWIFGAIGTQLTKNFSDIDLVEPGAEGRISGFYFANGTQHLDHDTQQNHLAGNTISDLLYKGALMDESRSVWQGMIYVAPGADGTDGYQANRNLILSKGARADSIPGLEILADDVRCTHGATVGNIDEDELFYLYSRGIPEGEARQLIVMGFFERIMDRIPFEGVQNRFKDAIIDKMSGA